MATDNVNRGRTRRLFKVIMYEILLIIVVVVLGLYFFQRALIYHPEGYSSQELSSLPNGLVALRDNDSIIAFYRPPATGTLQKLWFIFGGNADRALRWDNFVQPTATPGVGFLLVEYPGYGAHAGKPSPENILRGSERALELLLAHVNLKELPVLPSAFGHSLGAAAATQWAAQHPVENLVLISPFTTMKAMAKRTVGWPLCELLVHRFDNEQRLTELIQRQLPQTTIIHGDKDPLIPIAMSYQLAGMDPRIHMTVIAGANHNDVLDLGYEEILRAMRLNNNQ
jgi:uncharacterized protein